MSYLSEMVQAFIGLIIGYAPCLVGWWLYLCFSSFKRKSRIEPQAEPPTELIIETLAIGEEQYLGPEMRPLMLSLLHSYAGVYANFSVTGNADFQVWPEKIGNNTFVLHLSLISKLFNPLDEVQYCHLMQLVGTNIANPEFTIPESTIARRESIRAACRAKKELCK